MWNEGGRRFCRSKVCFSDWFSRLCLDAFVLGVVVAVDVRFQMAVIIVSVLACLVG